MKLRAGGVETSDLEMGFDDFWGLDFLRFSVFTLTHTYRSSGRN